MTKTLAAAALAALLAAPAALSAQHGSHAQPQQQEQPKQPSPFTALEMREELRLTPEQVSRLTTARDSLREAHRVHCAPMHASKPTEAEEARHHEEMAAINARWEGQGRAALTAEQLSRLAALHAAHAPAAAAGHGGHHGQGHQGQEHQGHHPAPAAGAKPRR